MGHPKHPKHPKNEVNEALDHADALGHTVEQTAAGHTWSRLLCVRGHQVSI
jgi:hypothetical protein